VGHIISQHGVATDPSKTVAMENWPTPTNITELRGFLGLTGYYRKFVSKYGILAKPLTRLLQKKQFAWSKEAETAFIALKKAMVTTLVLALPQFDKPFIIETDVCDEGVGAVLMQFDKPIAYLSKALREKNRALSIYEKEFLALMLAVDKWKQYLQHSEFIIKTNHRALSFLEDQTLHSDYQRLFILIIRGKLWPN
jgi:hypothetical protein